MKNIIMLIVDGTYPEDVREMSLTRYFSSCKEGYEALQYMLMLLACLRIFNLRLQLFSAGEYRQSNERRIQSPVETL